MSVLWFYVTRQKGTSGPVISICLSLSLCSILSRSFHLYLHLYNGKGLGPLLSYAAKTEMTSLMAECGFNLSNHLFVLGSNSTCEWRLKGLEGIRVFHILGWAPSMIYKASHFSSFISYHEKERTFQGFFCPKSFLWIVRYLWYFSKCFLWTLCTGWKCFLMLILSS